MFDQTLLPEEDFSGGKLLRKRRTSGHTDPEPAPKRRKTTPSTSSPPKNDENLPDQIEVSSRPPRIPPPQRPVSQPVSALQQQPTPTTPPPRSLTSQIGVREFRVRDKSINYTIPPPLSLKSLLPTPPPRKRRSSAPPSQLLIPKKIRTDHPPPAPHIAAVTTPIQRPSPRPVGRPRLLRTITQRNGEKMLLIKLRVTASKLAPLVRKPRIRIVEGTSSGRKRRIREDEEVEEIPAEPKRELEKPFGGILTKEDADTSKTTPTEIDRMRFDRARDTAMVVPFIEIEINRRLVHRHNQVSLLRGQHPKFPPVLVVIPLPRQHSKSEL
jgi:hypothetical protein